MPPSNGGVTLVAKSKIPEYPAGYRSLLLLGSEIAGFAILGLMIDFALGNLDKLPWATLIMSPLGLVVALWHLIRTVRSSGKG